MDLLPPEVTKCEKLENEVKWMMRVLRSATSSIYATSNGELLQCPEGH